MANAVNQNPIYLDTFTSDITVSSDPITVSTIVFFSDTAGDDFTLTDVNVIKTFLRGGVGTAGEPFILPLGKHTFESLKVDISAGTFAATARMMIFLK